MRMIILETITNVEKMGVKWGVGARVRWAPHALPPWRTYVCTLVHEYVPDTCTPSHHISEHDQNLAQQWRVSGSFHVLNVSREMYAPISSTASALSPAHCPLGAGARSPLPRSHELLSARSFMFRFISIRSKPIQGRRAAVLVVAQIRLPPFSSSFTSTL